jgi:hypothetical protein
MINENTTTKPSNSKGVRYSDLLVKFSTLALGSRFRYPDAKTIWVKLNWRGTIVEWDKARETHTWIGQSIVSFGEEDGEDGDVIICD